MLGPLLFLIYIDIYNSSDKLSFYLFADDTILLYADKNLKSLEKSVNNELLKVSEWLNANKLTLNAKKSNYVIFRPYQRKQGYLVNIQMLDNSTYTSTSLECKEHVKYLGILLDSNLSWKFHIEYVALKISKIIGVIACLRHFVPLHTLLNIYCSLIFPYMSYGLAAWGQAAKTIYINSLYCKNVSFVYCIFLSPEHTPCLCLSPQIFFPEICSMLKLFLL